MAGSFHKVPTLAFIFLRMHSSSPAETQSLQAERSKYWFLGLSANNPKIIHKKCNLENSDFLGFQVEWNVFSDWLLNWMSDNCTASYECGDAQPHLMYIIKLVSFHEHHE